MTVESSRGFKVFLPKSLSSNFRGGPPFEPLEGTQRNQIALSRRRILEFRFPTTFPDDLIWNIKFIARKGFGAVRPQWPRGNKVHSSREFPRTSYEFLGGGGKANTSELFIIPMASGPA